MAFTLPLIAYVQKQLSYRINFMTHGGSTYLTADTEQDCDTTAIEYAYRINVPRIGAGFEVWDRERLVHRHRN